MDSIRKFAALYTKSSSKKRKVYQDGCVILLKKNSGIVAALLNDESSEIFRKQITEETVRLLSTPGVEMELGPYAIQLEDEIFELSVINKENIKVPKLTESTRIPSTTKQINKPFVSSQKTVTNKISDSNFTKDNSNSNTTTPVLLDPSLERVMRPHQVEAALFLITCLQGKPEVVVDNDYEKTKKIPSDGNLNDDDDDNDIWEECPRSPSPPPSPKKKSKPRIYSGAILGDEMGLGKTLTAIAVLWSFVRNGRGKAVIVCPSSLVDNWEKEIKKWMSVKLKPVCARSGPSADEAVDTFRVSHA
eukprot:gene10825-22578_t